MNYEQNLLFKVLSYEPDFVVNAINGYTLALKVLKLKIMDLLKKIMSNIFLARTA